MHDNRKGISILLSLVLVVVIAACSRKTLSVFFDGVPPEQDSSMIAGANPVRRTDTLARGLRPDTMMARRSTHPPFAYKKCETCHDQSRKGKLLMEPPALCSLCHGDWVVLNRYTHGPAAGGYCLSCHAPHASENPKLLLRKGQDICLHCHEKQEVFDHEPHGETGDTECTECHDPHGSNQRFFLK